MTQTYTYILELDGGTFVSQVVSDGIDESIEKWIVGIRNDPITKNALSEFVISQIRQSVVDPDTGIIALKGIKDVWYNDLETDLGNGHLHIVLSEKNES